MLKINIRPYNNYKIIKNIKKKSTKITNIKAFNITHNINRKKNNKRLGYIATTFYLLPLSDIIRRLRNVVNYYPSNLLLYQFLIYPHFVIFYTTFSMLTTFILFQKMILMNPKTPRFLKEHALLANILDIFLIYLYNLALITSPYFRWSFLHSFLDIVVYSVALILIMYCMLSAFIFKIPKFSKPFDKVIKKFRGFYQMEEF